MAKVLTFLYPECGYQVDILLGGVDLPARIKRLLGPDISKRHRRECEVCRERRRERFRGTSAPEEGIVFRTGVDKSTQATPSQVD